MSNKSKKKKARNKSKGWLMDYYMTGREFDKENRRRREEEGEKEKKGLRGLNSFELWCIVIIVVALVGLFIKLVILKHDFWQPGI
ncbi:MAG: hypothetical protein ACOX4R_07430 [Lentihominibacter sp.]|jgi:hypothetical protein